MEVADGSIQLLLIATEFAAVRLLVQHNLSGMTNWCDVSGHLLSAEEMREKILAAKEAEDDADTRTLPERQWARQWEEVREQLVIDPRDKNCKRVLPIYLHRLSHPAAYKGVTHPVADNERIRVWTDGSKKENRNLVQYTVSETPYEHRTRVSHIKLDDLVALSTPTLNSDEFDTFGSWLEEKKPYDSTPESLDSFLNWLRQRCSYKYEH